jgi:hypothetical protein
VPKGAKEEGVSGSRGRRVERGEERSGRVGGVMVEVRKIEYGL